MFYGITLAELGWGRALLVALCGYVTVFLMMLALVCVIKVVSKVVGGMGNKKPAAAPAPAKKAAAPAPAAPAEVKAPEAPAAESTTPVEAAQAPAASN